MDAGHPVASGHKELYGAGDMLIALGLSPSLSGLALFSAMVATVMIGILAATVLVGQAIGLPATVSQVLLWAAWLSWLGYFLPRHRERDLISAKAAYRKAFWRELMVGIAFNFSMVLRPLVVGLLNGWTVIGTPWSLAIGAFAAGLGVLAVFDGSRQLGISCAFFVYEYADASKPIVQEGIYGWLRHPLFVGGICVSVGLAICAGTSAALELAAVNVLILPIYRVIEDHRCSRALGESYAPYRRAVGGVFPRRTQG